MSCEICKRIKERKCVVVYEDENVVACLHKNQITKGRTTVFYKKHVTKFTSLSKIDRDSLMSSVARVGELLERALKPDHMNYLLLGNYYSHLHWHIIPRYHNREKDNYYFKNGLEYPILGRRIYGRYDASKEELKGIAKKIRKVLKV